MTEYIEKIKSLYDKQIFVLHLEKKVMEDEENINSLAEQIVLFHSLGIRICVIQDKCTSTFSSTSTSLMNALKERNVASIIVSGFSMNFMEASSFDSAPVFNLFQGNFVPIIEPIIPRWPDGKIEHIDSDELAKRVAITLKAEKLFFVTTLLGIPCFENDTKYPILSIDFIDIEKVIQDFPEGRITKRLRLSKQILKMGFGGIILLINGCEKDNLISNTLTDKKNGTTISHLYTEKELEELEAWVKTGPIDDDL